RHSGEPSLQTRRQKGEIPGPPVSPVPVSPDSPGVETAPASSWGCDGGRSGSADPAPAASGHPTDCIDEARYPPENRFSSPPPLRSSGHIGSSRHAAESADSGRRSGSTLLFPPL